MKQEGRHGIRVAIDLGLMELPRRCDRGRLSVKVVGAYDG